MTEEYSWETEDNGSTLDTQETEQQLVYITNLKGGLQSDSMKLHDDEGPNNKKPASKIGIFKPTQHNLNHIYKLYEESGSDNNNIDETVKGENKKNLKERSYTNMDEAKEGKEADLLSKGKLRNHHNIPRKKGKMRKLWSPRKWPCQTWGKTFL